MKTSSIIFSVLLLLSINVGYCQFEKEGWQWAFSYSGLEGDNYENNTILKIETDSVGDVYMLSTFGYWAEIDGEELQGEYYNGDNRSVLLAKFSKQTGKMLWKKVIGMSYLSQTSSMLLRNNKITLFTSFLQQRPCSYNEFIYYLDTVYFADNYSDHVLDTIPGYSFPFNGYIPFSSLVTFDLDGNKIDEHFIQMVNRREDSIYFTTKKQFSVDLANIDSAGNYYFIGRYEIYDSDTAKPYTILIDDSIGYTFKSKQMHSGSRGFDNQVKMSYQTLFKFSPDMELLWQKPIISHFENIKCQYPDMDTINIHFRDTIDPRILWYKFKAAENNDNINDLYIYGYFTATPAYAKIQSYPAYIYFDSIHYIEISNKLEEFTVPFIFKIDTMGNVEWVDKVQHIKVNDSLDNRNVHCCGTYPSIHDSIIYVRGSARISSQQYDVFFDEEYQNKLRVPYDNDTINTPQNSFDVYSEFRYYKKLNKYTGEYLGYGGFYQGDYFGTGRYTQDTVVKNRFAIPIFTNILKVNDTLYSWSNVRMKDWGESMFDFTYNYSNAILIAWDTNDNYLGIVDSLPPTDVPMMYGKNDGNVVTYWGGFWNEYNQVSDLCFNDTLCVHLSSNRTNVTVAMYHHPRFKQRDTVPHNEEPPQDEPDSNGIDPHSKDKNAIKVYPNPAWSYISIDIPSEEHLKKAEIVDMSGKVVQTSEQKKFKVSSLPAGTYFLKVYTNTGNYIRKIVRQ